MKVFISQPMRGRTDKEILEERERIIEIVKEDYENVEVLDTFFAGNNWGAVKCLGKSIELLSEADVVVFAPGWERMRGCKIEHTVAEEYGLNIMEVLSVG